MTTIILTYAEKQTNRGRRMHACTDRWRRSQGRDSFHFLNTFSVEQQSFVRENKGTLKPTEIARELRITVYMLQKLIHELDIYYQ